MADVLFKNDYGHKYEIDTQENLSLLNPSTREIILKSPKTKQKIIKPAAINGTVLEYQTNAGDSGDLFEVGQWQIQARIAGTGFDQVTTIGTFTVNERL